MHKCVGMDHNKKKYRKAEYVQCRVCFVNVQSSLHENDVFSVCAFMGNAAYIIFIMWNSISDLEAWYHFQTSVVVWLSRRGGPIFEVIFIIKVIFTFDVIINSEIVLSFC